MDCLITFQPFKHFLVHFWSHWSWFYIIWAISNFLNLFEISWNFINFFQQFFFWNFWTVWKCFEIFWTFLEQFQKYLNRFQLFPSRFQVNLFLVQGILFCPSAQLAPLGFHTDFFSLIRLVVIFQKFCFEMFLNTIEPIQYF